MSLLICQVLLQCVPAYCLHSVLVCLTAISVAVTECLRLGKFIKERSWLWLLLPEAGETESAVPANGQACCCFTSQGKAGGVTCEWEAERGGPHCHSCLEGDNPGPEEPLCSFMRVEAPETITLEGSSTTQHCCTRGSFQAPLHKAAYVFGRSLCPSCGTDFCQSPTGALRKPTVS